MLVHNNTLCPSHISRSPLVCLSQTQKMERMDLKSNSANLEVSSGLLGVKDTWMAMARRSSISPGAMSISLVGSEDMVENKLPNLNLKYDIPKKNFLREYLS